MQHFLDLNKTDPADLREIIDKIAKDGVRHVAVLCPSFVADCLETLEEIGLRAEAQFRAAGGEKLTMIPSLNASQAWVDVVARLARRGALSHP